MNVSSWLLFVIPRFGNNIGRALLTEPKKLYDRQLPVVSLTYSAILLAEIKWRRCHRQQRPSVATEFVGLSFDTAATDNGDMLCGLSALTGVRPGLKLACDEAALSKAGGGVIHVLIEKPGHPTMLAAGAD